ncbi:uncharacterized protein LOC131040265 [Cryptomeria japonica]|uniref:uncharacterized protein LOC131040265 n=1 Tax=Cryptomeria japonica TaxID=3369 RepID=UPI0027DA2194|nr:uncharacterized protein LOC131040265 [Cryptomeria japonica]
MGMIACSQKKMEMGMIGAEKEELNVIIAVDGKGHSITEESILACEWTCKELVSKLLNPSFSINLTILNVQKKIADNAFTNRNIKSWNLYYKKLSERVLEEALNICKKNLKIEAKPSCVVGGEENPQKKICEAVQLLGADLLIMGGRRHCAFRRAIMGCVTEYCSRNAACPVLVITKQKYSSLSNEYPTFVSDDTKSIK